MPILTNLDEKPVPLYDENNPDTLAAIPSFRHLLKLAAGQGHPKNADESRRLGRIIKKLRQGGDLELDGDEFKALFDRIVENQALMFTHIHAQLLEKLESANR